MRRERCFGRPLPPKPVEMGKEYDVDIENISRLGQGIARIQGFVHACMQEKEVRISRDRQGKESV